MRFPEDGSPPRRAREKNLWYPGYKRLHHAFLIIFETRHTVLIMASLNVFVKLLPSSPFRLFPCFFIGVHRFLSASCFYFHLSNSWAMHAVSISFSKLEIIGWHVFDIRSGHIYFQGQYSLYFFPFVCSIFLLYSLLWSILFSMLSLLLFYAAAPGISVLQGSLIPCRITGT